MRGKDIFGNWLVQLFHLDINLAGKELSYTLLKLSGNEDLCDCWNNIFALVVMDRQDLSKNEPEKEVLLSWVDKSFVLMLIVSDVVFHSIQKMWLYDILSGL